MIRGSQDSTNTGIARREIQTKVLTRTASTVAHFVGTPIHSIKPLIRSVYHMHPIFCHNANSVKRIVQCIELVLNYLNHLQRKVGISLNIVVQHGHSDDFVDVHVDDVLHGHRYVQRQRYGFARRLVGGRRDGGFGSGHGCGGLRRFLANEDGDDGIVAEGLAAGIAHAVGASIDSVESVEGGVDHGEVVLGQVAVPVESFGEGYVSLDDGLDRKGIDFVSANVVHQNVDADGCIDGSGALIVDRHGTIVGRGRFGGWSLGRGRRGRSGGCRGDGGSRRDCRGCRRSR